MMESDFARRVLERMGRAEVDVPSAQERDARFARMTRVVEASLTRARIQRTARQRAFLGASGFAVAASVALFVFLGTPGEPIAQGASVLSVTGSVELRTSAGASPEVGRAGRTLGSTEELRTARESHAVVRLLSGAVVAVASSTDLRFEGGGGEVERLNLHQGNVSLSVPKLGTGRTLSVVTPDATIVVRGTRFSVGVDGDPPSSNTQVAVQEGRVEVLHRGRGTFLGPGQSWSSRPAPAVISAPAPAPVPAPPVVKPGASSRERVSRKTPAAGDPNVLAIENQLLARALSRSRAGAVAEALTDLERLQREYPRSPLIQSARAEYFRLLRESGRTQDAAREARRYLSDYPQGFARDDAKRTVLPGVQGVP